MLAIGIDPGTASTGFGLVRQESGGRIEVVDFGVLATGSDTRMPDRLLDLHRQLGALLSLHRPESGAVETLFFQRNVSTAISVGQARGVILLALAEASIPVSEYSPREVKQAVAGYGAAEKRQMQDMVRILLGLKDVPRPDDAADALAVAICHLHTQATRTRTGEAT
jgi:crossover junction endodeoxyribonuclease RuvC